jgi:hypothetical protein
MKKFTLLFVSLFSILITSSFAGSFSESKKEAIVDNLIVGIKSENYGIRTSAAYILGDLVEQQYLDKVDASEGVSYLMNMLRSGSTDEEKIIAALSLYKIGNLQGIYLLRGIAKFDDSQRVRNISKNLYCNFHKVNHSFYFCNF